MTNPLKAPPTPEDAGAHAHPWKISDVVLFPLLAMGLVLEWVWPTTLYLWRPIGGLLGVALFLFGFWLISRAKTELDKAHQPSLPGTATTQLVTTGPFAWSRNPNYLGAALAGIGGALALDSAWLVAATLLACAILEVWMIRPEERYLAERFAEEYQDYRRRTRRWL
ncbi:isoprenylcysteine carboxylmethyltransferase family protein [Fluviibacterium sp. DFM31]|uniref:Isoprenylcysteine carboxylmethyltransferase family protein n=1 Tax=Meridianimarinicoccus marinus TaxID=3231483 RepID=A0ABV3L7L9_9RHOB